MTEQSWIFSIGILIAVISYFAKNFIFDQLLIYRKTVGRARNRLRYHSNIITNDEFSQEVVRPIQEELRQLSCDLDESYYSIPFVSKLFRVYFTPSPENFDEAARQLIFLSNNTGRRNSVEKNDKAIEKVLASLKVNKKL